MLFNERDLEDYICNNQEQFIATLKKEIYGEDCDIEFIGRQVKIGEDNIADIDFRTVRWGRADEYIDNLKLDERIEKLYE